MNKILIVVICFAFFAPLTVGNRGVELSVASAKCGSYCSALKVAKRVWGKFTGTGTGENIPIPSTSIGTQPFAGRVVAPFWCNVNGMIAFFIVPTAGVEGPYGVSPASLKSYYSVYPGNNVLGTSYPGGVCIFGIGVYSFAFPLAQTVTLNPGMGTSLTPGVL